MCLCSQGPYFAGFLYLIVRTEHLGQPLWDFKAKEKHDHIYLLTNINISCNS